MSRYIDAEFEIEHYTSMTTHPTPDVSEKDKRDSLIVLEALRRAKSIDIVRCRECNEADFGGLHSKDRCYCMKHSCYMYVDDFCSYGEREGE